MRTRPSNLSIGFGVLLMVAAVGCSDDAQSPDASVGDGGTDVLKRDGAGDAVAVVNTATGSVKGRVWDKARAFLGIPYAAPPVGPLRFSPPRPRAPWKAVRDATKHGPSCPQQQTVGFGPPKNYSEDCLSLSVWTPYPAPAKKLPVMVWIHGGGFILGGSATALYDGKALVASGKVVVVGINYRLGPLGTFAHPALKQSEGNFGLLDQQAALRWVRDNIAAFGGDPGNVTIFGESAGALSVCLHLVAPNSKGLFHRAVMQSGTCAVALTRAQAEAQGQELAKAVGCDTTGDPIACLRGKPADLLNKALPIPPGFFLGDGASWVPFVDGATLEEQPVKTLAAKKMQKVPVLLGSNKNEGTLFVSLAKLEAISEAGYRAAIAKLAPSLGVKAADLLAQYPASSFTTPADALAEVLGDAVFVCRARWLARLIASEGAPTFVYHFERAPIAYAALPFYRATHAAEISFVFGNYLLGLKFPAAELPLHRAMANYWRRFAEGGDPNGGSEPAWPAFTEAGDESLRLDLKIEKGAGLKTARCDFWETAQPF